MKLGWQEAGESDGEEDEDSLELEPQQGPTGTQQKTRGPRMIMDTGGQQDEHPGHEANGGTGGISGEMLGQLLINAGSCGPEMLARTLECLERWNQVHNLGQVTPIGKAPEVHQARLIEDAPGPSLFDGKLVDTGP